MQSIVLEVFMNRTFLLAGIVLTLGIVGAVASQPRRVFISSGSMQPTLGVATYIKVQRGSYRQVADVARGDIITYERLDPSSKQQRQSVTRVIGLPGDKVQLNSTKVWINGGLLPHKKVGQKGKVSLWQETSGVANYQVQYGDNTAPSPAFTGTVPSNQFFCVGDNRDNAYDSRYTGSVPFAAIIGKKAP